MLRRRQWRRMPDSSTLTGDTKYHWLATRGSFMTTAVRTSRACMLAKSRRISLMLFLCVKSIRTCERAERVSRCLRTRQERRHSIALTLLPNLSDLRTRRRPIDPLKLLLLSGRIPCCSLVIQGMPLLSCWLMPGPRFFPKCYTSSLESSKLLRRV